MSGNNNNNRPPLASTAATVAIGAAVGYGAYKLFQSMFGSAEPHKADTWQPDGQPGWAAAEKEYISVVATGAELHDALEELKSDFNESKVLSFDCEWVSDQNGRHPVAILQLCSHSGKCVVIQLLKFRSFPSELRAILEDSRIIKVGVAPYTDAKFLRDDYGVCVTSKLDLRYMAHKASCNPGKLKYMTKTYLSDFGFVMDDSLQCSDWENDKLSHAQVQYAAADVEAANELCKFFAGKIAPGKSPEYTIKNYCSEYIDKNYGPPRN